MSIYQSATNSTSLPVIAGVEITTDAEGRFNLNALHKASGEGDHKKPSAWLRGKQAQELISELEIQLDQSANLHSGHKSLNVVNGGINPGTFAHELIALSYAGWIKPAFQLQVNQVFLDYRTGKLQPIQQRDPMEVLNDPDALRGLLLNYSQEVKSLRSEVAEAKPMVEAFDKIAVADGSFNMTESAKVLQVKPSVLRKHLHANRWIYRRNGSKNWLGYQDRIQSGVIEHKINVYEKEDGSQGVSEQVRITPKGITRLAMELTQGGAL
jgi:phage antirepressor YoqD-like protein